jgi:hypothetical protein
MRHLKPSLKIKLWSKSLLNTYFMSGQLVHIQGL